MLQGLYILHSARVIIIQEPWAFFSLNKSGINFGTFTCFTLRMFSLSSKIPQNKTYCHYFFCRKKRKLIIKVEGRADAHSFWPAFYTLQNIWFYVFLSEMFQKTWGKPQCICNYPYALSVCVMRLQLRSQAQCSHTLRNFS